MKRGSIVTLFDEAVIAAGTASASGAIDIFNLNGWYAKKLTNLNGYYCLELKVTGDGVLKAEYESSLTGESFMVPKNESPILQGFTKTGGANGDGKTIFQFSPHFSKFIRLKLSETGGTDSVTVTAVLGIL